MDDTAGEEAARLVPGLVAPGTAAGTAGAIAEGTRDISILRNICARRLRSVEPTKLSGNPSGTSRNNPEAAMAPPRPSTMAARLVVTSTRAV